MNLNRNPFKKVPGQSKTSKLFKIKWIKTIHFKLVNANLKNLQLMEVSFK